MSVTEITHYFFKIENIRSKVFFVSTRRSCSVSRGFCSLTTKLEIEKFRVWLIKFSKNSKYLPDNQLRRKRIFLKKNCSHFEQPHLMPRERNLKKETFPRERICTNVSARVLTHICSPSILFYFWFIDCSIQLCSISTQ